MPEVARGQCSVFSLGSLLHLVEGEGVTGRLSVGTGTITLYRGNPVDARVRRLSGVAALLELFVHAGETFAIETLDDVAPARPIGDISMLVLEGCRLQDEWARLGTLHLAIPAGAALPAPLSPLAPFLDGNRTVTAAAEAARLERAALIDPLLKALEAGLLREVAPRRASPAVAPDDAYDRAMETARRFVRDGRLDDAHTHFQAALASRPDDRIALQNLRRIAALQGTA